MNALDMFAGLDWWSVAGWTMLHYLWLGLVGGAVAGVLRFALRRASAQVRYAVALVSLAALAVLPVGVGIGVGGRVSGVRESGGERVADVGAKPHPVVGAGRSEARVEGVGVEESAKPQAAGDAVEIISAPEMVRGVAPAPVDAAPMVVRPLADWSGVVDVAASWLPWVWIVGAPVTFLLLCTGVVGAERLRRESRLVVDGPVVECLERLRASLSIGRRVAVAVCERVATPVLVGVVRPLILLPPAALSGWSPDEIEMVLLHELAHVRRWDNLVNLVQRFVEAVLFFQPAVWLVSGWVRREREACCDAVVVRATQRPQEYAELLVEMAARMFEAGEAGPDRPRLSIFTRGRGRPGSRGSQGALVSAMAAGPLRGRIRRILGIHDDPMLVSGRSLGVVMSGLLLAATLVVLNLPTRSEAEQKSGFTTEDTENTEGKAEVRFEVGASRFDEGDKIEISTVRGTKSAFEPGGTYWIEGTYTLASRERASLSAFVTAKKAGDGRTSIDKEQTMTVERGSGKFSLKLRMPYEGWPHVSFYPDGGGEGFGGVYFGTGDSVLTKWWDEKKRTTEGMESTEEKTELGQQRATTQNHLKDLMLAILNYESVERSFPKRAHFDENGKPLLSWRVMILPYLPQAHLNPDSDEAKLYMEFHLDEPWDSEHNRKLIARMPKVFQNPRIDRPGFTNYLGVVGEECMFRGDDQAVQLKHVSDGISRTIAVVEADADRAVEWTKPADWEFERERPTAGLGGLWPTGWYAAFVDGRVTHVSNRESPEEVGIQFTRGGGETKSLAESAGSMGGEGVVAMDDGNRDSAPGEMSEGPGVASMAGDELGGAMGRGEELALDVPESEFPTLVGQKTDLTTEGTESTEGKTERASGFDVGVPDTAEVFVVSDDNPEEARSYALLSKAREPLLVNLESLRNGGLGVDMPFTYTASKEQSNVVDVVAAKAAHEKFFAGYVRLFDEGLIGPVKVEGATAPGTGKVSPDLKQEGAKPDMVRAKFVSRPDNLLETRKYEISNAPNTMLRLEWMVEILKRDPSEPKPVFGYNWTHDWTRLEVIAPKEGQEFVKPMIVNAQSSVATRTTENTESWEEKAEEKSPTAGLEESLAKKISYCVALFNAPGRSGDLKELSKKFRDEGRTLYLYGYTVDPNSREGKRFRLTGAPTCIVFQHGQETGRLDMIQTREQLVQFVEAESPKNTLPASAEQRQGDDWLKGVVFASPKEGEILWRAKELLGVRIVPAAEDELRAARQKGFDAALKILDPIAKGPVADAPIILVSLNGVVIKDYDVLAQMLREISNRRMNESLTQVGVGGVVGEREFLSTIELPKLDSLEIHDDKSIGTANQPARSMVAGNEPLSADELLKRDMQPSDRERIGFVARRKFIPTTENLVETRHYEIADSSRAVLDLDSVTAVLNADRSEPRPVWGFSWSHNFTKLKVIAPREGQEFIAALLKGAIAPTTQVAAGAEPAKGSPSTSSVGKFPTLEEQKLADLIWKRMNGLELEPLTAEQQKKVQEFGYEGGLRNSTNNASGLQQGDILVGLHVWPTKSLQDVVNVLNRDDLGELNPLKYYVVREGQYGGASVVTGRIEVNRERQRSRSGAANRYSDEVPTKPRAATGKSAVPMVDPEPAMGYSAPTPASPPATASAPQVATGLPVPSMPNAVARRVEGQSAPVLTRVKPDGTVEEEMLQNRYGPPPASVSRTPSMPSPAANAPQASTTRPADASHLDNESQAPLLSDEVTAKLREDGPVTLLFFFARGSKPCQQMSATFDELVLAHPNLPLKIYSRDIQLDRESSVTYDIERVPALVFHNEGKVIRKYYGFVSSEELAKLVTDVANSLRAPESAATSQTTPSASAEQTKSAAIDRLIDTKVADDPNMEMMRQELMSLEYQLNSQAANTTSDDTRETKRLRALIVAKRAKIDAYRKQVREQLANANQQKAALRYDGKTFDQWRTEWQTELSTAKRIEAVKALAAFGRAGYGKEAAAVILDVAGEYDFTFMQNDNDANGKLKRAVVEVLSPESGRPSLAEFWLPDLVGRMKDDAGKWQPLLAYAVGQLRSDNPQVIGLLRTLAVEGPAEVRGGALGALVRSERVFNRTGELTEETRKLLAAALTSDDLDQRRSALWLLVYDPNNPWALGWNGMGDARLFYLPEIVGPLLGGDEELRQRARLQLQYVQAKDAPALLGQLLKVLSDESRTAEHVEAIRAIAAMGPAGVAATEELKQIVLDGKDEDAIIAALFAAACVNDKGISTLLVSGNNPTSEIALRASERTVPALQLDQRQIDTLQKRTSEINRFSTRFEHEAEVLFPESRPRPGGGMF